MVCSYHGQSGSPVWLYNTTSGDRYIRGILSSSGAGSSSDAAGPGAFTLISEVPLLSHNLGHHQHVPSDAYEEACIPVASLLVGDSFDNNCWLGCTSKLWVVYHGDSQTILRLSR